MSKVKHYVLSFLFISILGVLLHFTYSWSGNNLLVGLFSAIDESIWEHLKLIFFPMLLLTLYDIFHYHKNNDIFLPARVAGILSGMLFTVIVFYTYSGIIGKSYDYVNIIIYFLSVAYALYIEHKKIGKTRFIDNVSASFILIILVVLFFLFTFTKPQIGLFANP